MAEKNFYISKSNFTGGQWAEEMRGRFDLPQYDSALEVMQNFTPIPQGGAKVRPGTRFVAHTAYQTGSRVCLLDFEFNNEQTYIIESGHQYMRFYTAGSRIEGTPTAITGAANNGSGKIRITSNGHGLSNGNQIAIRGVLGTYEANGDNVTIEGVTANTFDITGSTFTHAYISGGVWSTIYQIATPYDESDVFQIKTCGEFDTLYLFHPEYATRKLVRTSATTFSLSTVDWQITPFFNTNVTGTTIQPQGTAVNSTILMNSSSALFNSNSVGYYYRVANGVVKVTAFINSTAVNAVIRKTTVNSATTDWAEGSWSPTRGYPVDGEFYENRLVVVGSSTQPLTMWGSKYFPEQENFDKGTALASDSYEYELRSRHASAIRWIVGDDLLFVGTAGREFKVTGSENSAITPTSVLARPQSSHGTLDTEPVVTTGGVVFPQRTGKKVRVIRFSLEQDKYLAPDTTLLAKTVVENGVVQLTYEAEPNELVYAVLQDGKYSTLTLLTDQNVQAWATHQTRGSVLSAKSIKTSGNDQTWFVTSRSIGGNTTYQIEYLDPTIALDCAVVGEFESSVSTIASGLGHLEGELVTVVGDNSVYPSQTVTGHALPTALDSPASQIIVGIPFTPYLKLLPPGKELPDGFIAGRRFKITKVKLLVKDTVGLSVNGQRNYARSTADDMDTPPVPGSEYIEFEPLIDWDQPLEITQELPLPAQILSATMYVQIGD